MEVKKANMFSHLVPGIIETEVQWRSPLGNSKGMQLLVRYVCYSILMDETGCRQP